MAHVTEAAIKAWQAGWQDAGDDIRRNRLPPRDINKHPSAYILGYMERRVVAATYVVSRDDFMYDDSLAYFMENYDL